MNRASARAAGSPSGGDCTATSSLLRVGLSRRDHSQLVAVTGERADPGWWRRVEVEPPALADRAASQLHRRGSPDVRPRHQPGRSSAARVPRPLGHDASARVRRPPCFAFRWFPPLLSQLPSSRGPHRLGTVRRSPVAGASRARSGCRSQPTRPPPADCNLVEQAQVLPRDGEGGHREGRADAGEAHLHSFRHTFAKRALESGAEITWLSRHLGHSSHEGVDPWCPDPCPKPSSTEHSNGHSSSSRSFSRDGQRKS